VQDSKALTRAQHLTFCDVIADLYLVEHRYDGADKDPRLVHNRFDVIENLLLLASLLLGDNLLSSGMLIGRLQVLQNAMAKTQ
jgi:hypothetical protein